MSFSQVEHMFIVNHFHTSITHFGHSLDKPPTQQMTHLSPSVKPGKKVLMLGTVMPTPADVGLSLDNKV
jgi:hypothetical protein